MAKINSALLILVALVLIFSSCDHNTATMMRNISGKAGEVIVVIPDETWKGPVGQVIRDILEQPQLALPQDEPLFDLIDVPPAAFTEIFKSHRNIIVAQISSEIDSSSVILKKNVWSHPQALVDIKAKTKQEFEELFVKNSDNMIAFFLKAEKERQMTNCRKYYDKAIFNTLKKEYNIDLLVPPGFKFAKKTNDFVWIRYETPDISQGIMIYTYPYQSDSTFTPNFLVAKRDSLFKVHVPGPTKGSYMATEKRVDPVYHVFELNGNYAAEMRGLWQVENDFMGGPYISITALDVSNKRVVTLDGYVYAPRFNKRNYLRQVEGIIYSLKFPDQAKNDKINSKIKSGN